MSENQQITKFPIGTFDAIIRAANPPALLPDRTKEALQKWLGSAVALAVLRAGKTRLTMADVEKLDAAYRRFCKVIDELQDRNDPPPRVPVSDGSTDWEHWLSGHQYFGFKRGRRESSDWRLIAALIAFYETISGTRASAAQNSGPTMRFLKTTLDALAQAAPTYARCNFALPTSEALKQQLPSLRKRAMLRDLKQLAMVMQPPG